MTPGPRATVLVVEDEPAFVEALRVGLGQEGFDVEVAQAEPGKGERGADYFVRSLRSRRNPDAAVDHRFCVLFNAYDAQSGGKRLMRLRTLSQQPESRAALLPLSSREALIDYFKDREVVRPGDVVEAGGE